MISFGVDIGGSGIKGAPVDLSTGQLTGDRYRLPTPQPATPDASIEAVRRVVEHHGWDRPLGVTVPGVVIGGVVLTAANIDSAWIGFDAQTQITDCLGLPVTILNDADAAGDDFITQDNPLAIEQFGRVEVLGQIPFIEPLTTPQPTADAWRIFEQNLPGLGKLMEVLK